MWPIFMWLKNKSERIEIVIIKMGTAMIKRLLVWMLTNTASVFVEFLYTYTR